MDLVCLLEIVVQNNNMWLKDIKNTAIIYYYYVLDLSYSVANVTEYYCNICCEPDLTMTGKMPSTNK